MTAIDYAAILAHRLADLPGTVGLIGRTRDTADAILAAKVPDLCPDCKGIGYLHWGDNNRQPCTHPNAPTISDLLALADTLTRVAADCQVSPETLIADGREVSNLRATFQRMAEARR